MDKRLASLFLLLVLFGGAFAGVPLSFGESNCSMGGMLDMECCKAALRLKEATKVSQEEVLCALNCAENQTTLPVGVVQVTPPTQTIHPVQRNLTPPLTIPLSFSRATQMHSPPGSPPTYLRNLTLLI